MEATIASKGDQYLTWLTQAPFPGDNTDVCTKISMVYKDTRKLIPIIGRKKGMGLQLLREVVIDFNHSLKNYVRIN